MPFGHFAYKGALGGWMEGRANNASRFSNEFPNEGRNGTFLQEGKCARGIKARRDTLSACRGEEWVGSSTVGHLRRLIK